MSDLAIVKIKARKKYLRDYYLIPEKADAFQENDIMMGIKYLRVVCRPVPPAPCYTSWSWKQLRQSYRQFPLSQVAQNCRGIFSALPP